MSSLDSDNEHFELIVRHLADRMIDQEKNLWSVSGMGFFKVFTVKESTLYFDVMTMDAKTQSSGCLSVQVRPNELLAGCSSGLMFVDMTGGLFDETILVDRYGFEPVRLKGLGPRGFFIKMEELRQVSQFSSSRERDQWIVDLTKNFGLKVSACAMFELHAAPMMNLACRNIHSRCLTSRDGKWIENPCDEMLEVFEWCRKKAESGDPVQQINVGSCYAQGRCVPQSYETAAYWYRMAALQGDCAAQYSFGRCLQYGVGVAKSEEDAIKWYRKSAEQEYSPAQFILGVCHEFGKGVAQSYDNAFYWYKKSADNGCAGSLNNLGECYRFGRGVGQSYAEAIRCYRKAIEQNEPVAKCNMGELYEAGEGVERSMEMAVKWYREAAEQGEMYSQYNLGKCYENGNGVEQSLIEAKRWYSKSADQGYEEAIVALRNLDCHK